MPGRRRNIEANALADGGRLLDALNLRLLAELERDPRLTMARLARRLGMSAPAVTERVRRLESAGVIRGYFVELEPSALGMPLGAVVRVRPGPGNLQRVAALARSTPEVVECHRVTGDDCFLMHVQVAGVEHLEEVLDRFLVYGQTNTSVVQSSPVPRRNPPLPQRRMAPATGR